MKIKLTLLLGALVIAGCGAGSGEGLDDNGNPVGATPTPEPQTGNGVTFAQLQDEIFDSPCAGCHDASGRAGLRLLDEDTSFGDLVGVASSQKPDLNRVEPGEPDNSYIVHKIEGGPNITGGQMPLGGAALSQEKIDMIRDWIANGAPRTGTGQAPTSVSKLNIDDKIDTVVFQLRFSRAVQEGSLTSDSVQVYFQSDENKRLAGPDEYSLSISGQELVVSVNSSVVDAQSIAVVVNDPSLSSVLDTQGRLIDGDKDLIDGGAYRYVYPL